MRESVPNIPGATCERVRHTRVLWLPVSAQLVAMVTTGSNETALFESCAVFSDVRPESNETVEHPTGDINAWFALKIKMRESLWVCY